MRGPIEDGQHGLGLGRFWSFEVVAFVGDDNHPNLALGGLVDAEEGVAHDAGLRHGIGGMGDDVDGKAHMQQGLPLPRLAHIGGANDEEGPGRHIEETSNAMERGDSLATALFKSEKNTAAHRADNAFHGGGLIGVHDSVTHNYAD